jgi:myo-inositol-1(or 4)-monophosphatase
MIDHPSISQLSNECKEIIQDATSLFYQLNTNNRTVWVKSAGLDLVTDVDIALQYFISAEIHKRYPSHMIVAEEDQHLDRKEFNRDYIWFIDPLDGTTNFVRGTPLFAISIGIARKGILVSACVSLPRLGDIYWAEIGMGAYHNGNKIHVSETRSIGDAVVATGLVSNRLLRKERTLCIIKNASQVIGDLRQSGCAVFDLVNLASGRLDVYWEQDLHSWDVAAGSLIVKESGGVVLLEGSLFAYDINAPINILATNDLLSTQSKEIFQMKNP